VVRVTDDMQAFSIRLPRDLHEWLRHESYVTRTAMNTVIAKALTDYRAKRVPGPVEFAPDIIACNHGHPDCPEYDHFDHDPETPDPKEQDR
jgi:hypothetical protein